jgi:carbonic anhydrase
MEMQIFHRNARGSFLVISVLFSTGTRNEFLDLLGWSQLPSAGQTFPASPSLDLSSALPDVLSYFTYVGSLSTPPCTEGVAWVVLDTTVGASQEQLSLFPNAGNIRPTQPLSSRRVFRLSDSMPAASWGYSGSVGPSSWAKLGFTACSSPNQSPIDISTSSALKLNCSALEIDWNAIGGLVVAAEANLLRIRIPEVSRATVGWATIPALSGAGSGSTPSLYTTFEDRQYHLEAIEFHAGSETRIDGKQFPLEAQFLHRDSSGLIMVRLMPDSFPPFATVPGIGWCQPPRLLSVGLLQVLAVLYSLGAHNMFLDELGWGKLPVSNGDFAEVKGAFNPNYLLPTSRNYYSYIGSLTSPPCTEKVRWVVMETPVTLSPAQAKQMPINGNFRPPQPLGSRQVAPQLTHATRSHAV